MKKMLFILALLMVALLSAQNSPIVLTSPNGGEVWQIGISYPITWGQLNLTGSVSLQLVGANSTQGMLIAQNIPVSASVYNWTIPPNIAPSGNYRIRISVGENAGYSFSDYSDAPFSIVSNDPPPSQFIRVISPNGGENWETGSTNMINWVSAGLEGEVRITLVQANGIQDIEIATNVPIQSGSLSWTIPATIPLGSGYKVHIMWLSILTVYFGDLSDGTFSITDSSPPPPAGLTIVTPNGGETWETGTTQAITWSAANIYGNVALHLFNGLNIAPVLQISSHTPAVAGVFNWLIPRNLVTSDQYYIRISTVASNGMMFSDYSDAPFSIVADNPPPPLEITVLSPNGGETFVKGTTHTITWTDNSPNASPMPPRVNIWLIRVHNGNRTRIPIARNIFSTGSYDWLVPRRILPGTRYFILIHRTGVPAIRDISDAPFSIVGQTITLSASPNPTKGSTSITVEASTGSTVEIDIYNIKGQKVRNLKHDMPLDGKMSLIWDGRDAKGQRVHSGIYFIRLNAGGEISTHKLIMLKN
jgi:hypothetical protein